METAEAANVTNNEVVKAPNRQDSWFPALLSLSLFSYAGVILRWVTGQIFGDACHKPDSSWISNWGACTTAPGTTEATGGVFFIDLPANIIGCFVMGFLVAGQADMLPVELPMAFLPRSSSFQQCKFTHLGMRTGFCGALTTFASWNTQMVVMLCGGIGTKLGYSQWVSVLWGYLIGWMLAIESFQMGRDLAHALSRRNNPDLAREADVIREKEESGIAIHVNSALPDFERRFLNDIMILEDKEIKAGHAGRRSALTDEYGSVSFSLRHSQSVSQTVAHLYRYGSDSYQKKYKDCIHYLQQWKESTKNHRQRGSELVEELYEIEKIVLTFQQEPSLELLEVLQDTGWNYDALKNWKDAAKAQELAPAVANNKGNTDHMEVIIHSIAFAVSTILLVWGAIYFSGGTNPTEVNFQMQCLSALLSPPGTILRWLLSKWNGKIHRKRWGWLPIGTLAANLLACIISALMPAIMLRVDAAPLISALLGAIKSGFAGSLSTVSTFAAETVGLFRALPRYFWGYYYSIGSLLLASVLGVITYVWAIA